MDRPALLLTWLALLGLASGCASQKVDPHTVGDHCLYTCPDGLTCLGTTFPRGTAKPGRCELRAERCLASADCRSGEHCVRPGDVVGVCQSEGLL